MSNIRGNGFPVVIKKMPVRDIQKYFDSQEMANLVEEYGTPMILNDSGQVTGVNQQCFAAMFEKIYKPIFETTEDCFYLYDPSTGLWVVTSKEVLMNKLHIAMFFNSAK